MVTVPIITFGFAWFDAWKKFPNGGEKMVMNLMGSQSVKKNPRIVWYQPGQNAMTTNIPMPTNFFSTYFCFGQYTREN